MNIFNDLFDLYTSLDTQNLIIFWVVTTLIILLIFECVILSTRNNKLKKLLNEKIDNQEIENITKTDSVSPVLPQQPTNNNAQKTVVNGPYKQNLLSSINNRDQSSPIAITKNKPETEIPSGVNIQKLEPVDIIDFNSVSPNNINTDNIAYLEQITKQYEDDTDAKTIGFTSFEEAQEKDSIISYEELLKAARGEEIVKIEPQISKVKYTLDTDDDQEFLNQLKTFRSNI